MSPIPIVVALVACCGTLLAPGWGLLWVSLSLGALTATVIDFTVRVARR